MASQEKYFERREAWFGVRVGRLLFRSAVTEEPDRRREYGKQRVRAYGKINGRLVVCVYTDRRISGRQVRWVISLLKANKREMRKFDDEAETN